MNTHQPNGAAMTKQLKIGKIARCKALDAKSYDDDPDVVTLKQFAAATGRTAGAAYSRLRRLCRNGIVTKVAYGAYRLPKESQ